MERAASVARINDDAGVKEDQRTEKQNDSKSEPTKLIMTNVFPVVHQ